MFRQFSAQHSESSQDTASISENISKAKVHSSPQKVDLKKMLGRSPSETRSTDNETLRYKNNITDLCEKR